MKSGMQKRFAILNKKNDGKEGQRSAVLSDFKQSFAATRILTIENHGGYSTRMIKHRHEPHYQLLDTCKTVSCSTTTTITAHHW